MPDGDDVTAPPLYIPHQRSPLQGAPASAVPPDSAAPAFAPPAIFVPPPRRPGPLAGVLALVAALAVGAGAIAVANHEPLDTAAEAARPTAKPRPLTPLELANQALERHSEALLRGDEKAWLAGVDPAQAKLRTRYRWMFRSLRSLGVTHFDYRTSVHAGDRKNPATVTADAQIAYCLADMPCPETGAPTVTQTLKIKPVAGRYVITSLVTRKSDEKQQPAPWEDGNLAFRKGKRVTLIALPTERRHFAEVLPLAERAATVNDRFAALVGNPQRRYRIYLAGSKQWKTWYGGITDKWIIAYASPLGEAGMDVVLNMDEMRGDPRLLATTIQHELAHVVTIGGVHRRSWGNGDMWLKEGIAEYIGWYPQPATASWRRPAVRRAVTSGKRPRTIAVTGLKAEARLVEGDAFYGLGHFAADCMAKKYGQRALFTFVRLYLREDRDLDPASREAFGKPFAAVDRACVAYIRDRA